jgi:hypothetical protein
LQLQSQNCPNRYVEKFSYANTSTEFL